MSACLNKLIIPRCGDGDIAVRWTLLAVQVQQFHQILRNDFQIPCTIRQEKGQDISGACGQLVIEYKDGGMQKNISDIEEVTARLLSKTACS